MGCSESRERRDPPAPQSTALRPNCGLCESPVHPDDRCSHSCGQAFHTVCYDSLVGGDDTAWCPRCRRPLLAGVATYDEQRHGIGPAAAAHRRNQPHHHRAAGTAHSAALFRALIAELEAMRRVLDQQERAAVPPATLDPSLQPRPVSSSAASAAVEADDCPICQDPLAGAATGAKARLSGCVELPCHHVFHAACADDWLQLKRECPLCRAAAHPSRHALAAEAAGE